MTENIFPPTPQKRRCSATLWRFSDFLGLEEIHSSGNENGTRSTTFPACWICLCSFICFVFCILFGQISCFTKNIVKSSFGFLKWFFLNKQRKPNLFLHVFPRHPYLCSNFHCQQHIFRPPLPSTFHGSPQFGRKSTPTIWEEMCSTGPREQSRKITRRFGKITFSHFFFAHVLPLFSEEKRFPFASSAGESPRFYPVGRVEGFLWLIDFGEARWEVKTVHVSKHSPIDGSTFWAWIFRKRWEVMGVAFILRRFYINFMIISKSFHIHFTVIQFCGLEILFVY